MGHGKAKDLDYHHHYHATTSIRSITITTTKTLTRVLRQPQLSAGGGIECTGVRYSHVGVCW